MPVACTGMVVASVACDQDLAITVGPASSVAVGAVQLPHSDGGKKTKMTFSADGQSSFTPRSSVQLVTTASATILPTTTILAVEFDGPVTLTLPSGASSIPTGMYIVDEGGFVSETNTLTVTSSSGVSGDITLTQPYSSLRVSPNPAGEWFLKKSVTVVNTDGSTSATNTDGSETTTFPDGTVNTTLTDPDGSTSYTTTSPDGTTTVGTTEANGDYTLFTTNPDGSTYEEEQDGTLTSTETFNVDGTSNATFEVDGGVSLSLDRDADGNITNFSFL